MSFKEEKDKYDLIFHRELSDREFAEAMYDRYMDILSDYNCLVNDHEELQEEYAKANTELRERMQIPKEYESVVQNIIGMLEAPAKRHMVTIWEKGGIITVDCNLDGAYEERIKEETLSE